MWLIAVAVVVIVLLLMGIAVISRYAFRQVTLWERSSLDSAFAAVEGFGLLTRAEFESMKKEDVSIMSKDGHRLRGYYIERYPDGNKVIILVHGYTANHIIAAQFISLFADEGFNVLLIDQRGHGRSEGSYASYGFHERGDLDAWVEFARQRAGTDAFIGLHGQSMGGGTVLMYAGINQHVKFIIADCPYSDMEALMKYQLKQLNRVPLFPFMRLLDRSLKKKVKFSMRQVKPIDEVKDKEIPLLLIHGDKDTFVPTQMSIDIHNRKRKGISELLIIDGAIHANAYPTDKERYRDKVHQFLQQVFEKEVTS
ncbi:alpha/beta hydrolase [Paenibacillus apiarius]|uniref:Alpha/beta hydrolase n=1 Tax=Paenibacillus apiarius TaxID=46240 RepID=A0ABT4DP93_9BACL|nr:alpha/beta hydrolase [Paenibacillus apiarius]MBN3522545.1 alpha/beta hydrolase [Paenibacillus apiarius]MCY9514605.1 alpha/beta hydrolase [Paenibacillus apiarius]MCY9518595.1 alpha/beta hydrolase [Paenibacillus apiarius]MCY9552683.1 alpha/beta hydrolase [Paenibacillus apiarius]MCY9556989.1 alpha/beta hydrolase [Paenibacillus apiarius]